MKNDNSGNDNDRLSLAEENELLKLKLSVENGARFLPEGDGPIDPEVENEWLKQIQSMHRAFEKAPRTTVFKKLGQPTVRPATKVPDHEIGEELDKLLALLAGHDLILNTIGEYPDRQLYRFIIEELFEEEIDDVADPGYQLVFLYEEFHPNPLLDAESGVEELIEALNQSNAEFVMWRFHPHFKDRQGATIGSDDVERRLNQMFDFFESAQLIDLKDAELKEAENTAIYRAHIKYSALPVGERQPLVFEGEMKAVLQPDPYAPLWSFCQLDVPGFQL